MDSFQKSDHGNRGGPHTYTLPPCSSLSTPSGLSICPARRQSVNALSALAFENPSKINVVGGTAGYPRSQAEFVSGLWVMCGWVMEAKANTGIPSPFDYAQGQDDGLRCCWIYEARVSRRRWRS